MQKNLFTLILFILLVGTFSTELTQLASRYCEQFESYEYTAQTKLPVESESFQINDYINKVKTSLIGSCSFLTAENILIEFPKGNRVTVSIHPSQLCDIANSNSSTYSAKLAATTLSDEKIDEIKISGCSPSDIGLRLNRVGLIDTYMKKKTRPNLSSAKPFMYRDTDGAVVNTDAFSFTIPSTSSSTAYVLVDGAVQATVNSDLLGSRVKTVNWCDIDSDTDCIDEPDVGGASYDAVYQHATHMAGLLSLQSGSISSYDEDTTTASGSGGYVGFATTSSVYNFNTIYNKNGPVYHPLTEDLVENAFTSSVKNGDDYEQSPDSTIHLFMTGDPVVSASKHYKIFTDVATNSLTASNKLDSILVNPSNVTHDWYAVLPAGNTDNTSGSYATAFGLDGLAHVNKNSLVVGAHQNGYAISNACQSEEHNARDDDWLKWSTDCSKITNNEDLVSFNNIMYSSAHGPTISGALRPHFSSVGASVGSSGYSSDGTASTEPLFLSGTSVAATTAAGILGSVLSNRTAYPSSNIRNYLIRGLSVASAANNDAEEDIEAIYYYYTGSSTLSRSTWTRPSRAWTSQAGWGLLSYKSLLSIMNNTDRWFDSSLVTDSEYDSEENIGTFFPVNTSAEVENVNGYAYEYTYETTTPYHLIGDTAIHSFKLHLDSNPYAVRVVLTYDDPTIYEDSSNSNYISTLINELEMMMVYEVDNVAYTRYPAAYARDPEDYTEHMKDTGAVKDTTQVIWLQVDSDTDVDMDSVYVYVYARRLVTDVDFSLSVTGGTIYSHEIIDTDDMTFDCDAPSSQLDGTSVETPMGCTCSAPHALYEDCSAEFLEPGLLTRTVFVTPFHSYWIAAGEGERITINATYDRDDDTPNSDAGFDPIPSKVGFLALVANAEEYDDVYIPRVPSVREAMANGRGKSSLVENSNSITIEANCNHVVGDKCFIHLISVDPRVDVSFKVYSYTDRLLAGVLVLVVIILGIGGIILFMFYRRRKASPMNPYLQKSAYGNNMTMGTQLGGAPSMGAGFGQPTANLSMIGSSPGGPAVAMVAQQNQQNPQIQPVQMQTADIGSRPNPNMGNNEPAGMKPAKMVNGQAVAKQGAVTPGRKAMTRDF